MNGFCPNCVKETSLVRVNETEELDIRGEMIPVEIEHFKCEECGEEFEKPDPNYDPLEIAYREYRRRKNMVQPEEIRKFRKKYGLTQKELSDLFGIGIATLNRYENGALQDEAHDRILRLGMEPHNFLELIERDPGLLDNALKENIIRKIQLEDEGSGNLLNIILDNYANYPPDLLSGYQKFDIYKFSRAIMFFCFKQGVFKTKLMKLLFYADFKHFKDYSVSITGARYAHGYHGPVPDRFETWLAILLEVEKWISKEEVWCYDNPGELFSSKSQPDLSLFTASEIKVLALVNEKFESFNAKQIRDFSHNEKGYQETQNGDLISYQYAETLQL